MEVLLKLYAKVNLGDDLFLKIICERYPQHNFYLLAGEEYVEVNKWPNLHLINRGFNDNLINKVLRGIGRKYAPFLFQKQLNKVYYKQFNYFKRDYDAFVSIGGSIFMQNQTDIRLDNEIIFYELINKVFANKPRFFIGCNFGPYQTQIYLEKYRELFEKATDVCFRDHYSYNLFKDLLTVRLAPDVVFGLKGNQEEIVKGTVGFSIVKARKDIQAEAYYKKYAELIKAYCKQGYKPYLFSFCQSEGDEAAIQIVTSYINNDYAVSKVCYNGDIDEFLSVYSSIESMYCGRFHAMILSMLYGQNVLPIIYSKKMTNVLNDVGYKGDIIEMESFQNIEIDNVVKRKLLKGYNISRESLMAANQFKALDEFLL